MYRRFGFPLLRGALLGAAGTGTSAATTVAYATEVIRAYGVERVPDVIAMLSNLVELADVGVLTGAEYAAARVRLLEAYRLTP